ncbi:sulfurtransferase [Paraliobacillus ryukyuensis]|uniref:sulfurtransferase n=1 Tax=Paraliobacillus ryukyuensis TaxID=200904 RepID=UPI0009A69C82|nr:sulfurtransferase [Paraliobacillus ryukyuensis]
MNFAVKNTWLADQLMNEQVRIVDCRFALGQPTKGIEDYQNSHLPGAVHFDLEKHLSGPVTEHGGRHPLPAIDTFKQALEQAGIDHTKTVVAYDAGEGAFASRFWWLITYLGHEDVYVLNEGFTGWVEAKLPTTKEIPTYPPTTFAVNLQADMLASYEEVKATVEQQANTSAILIDSRSPDRYAGEVEPIDRIAGHIPGAVNYFWKEGLTDGTFKDSDMQRQRFGAMNSDQPVIVYCGSGITATPNYIALKQAGYQHVKLYAGSYSDWISYPDNAVE